ncbi:hypothetical protein AAFF_G00218120 [Aldrovandia affinis]|uniref:Uncharacterized protein n=1 Tax=Aldrovandia affinis TaxID=143900 RepID=A0AAD7WUQ9_9TELE|nr:hypothetical protein AAFF_G00218120 [Aldrovandia affinis]
MSRASAHSRTVEVTNGEGAKPVILQESSELPSSFSVGPSKTNVPIWVRANLGGEQGMTSDTAEGEGQGGGHPRRDKGFTVTIHIATSGDDSGGGFTGPIERATREPFPEAALMRP